MIYFLINNNHQYVDFCNHLFVLDSEDVVLVEIPYALNCNKDDGIKNKLRYSRSAGNGLFDQVYKFLSTIGRIGRDIVPSVNDVLFFYTEYEILNQYLVRRFKQAGASVYLIEDGGFGTYVPFRRVDSEPLTIKELIKQSVYRLLPGLAGIRLHKINGHIFPWMPDSNIDAVCLYQPVAIKRNIPIKLMRRPSQSQLVTIPGSVFFLNEPIYEVYQTWDEYIEGLNILLEALCDGFKQVHFKFHPRESAERRQCIREKVLFRFPLLTVVEEDTAMEMLADQYRPSVVASYFCSALLELANRGIEPLYLYHLLSGLKKQPVFMEVTSILTELNYNYVSALSEIKDNYCSNLLGTPNIYLRETLQGIVDNE